MPLDQQKIRDRIHARELQRLRVRDYSRYVREVHLNELNQLGSPKLESAADKLLRKKSADDVHLQIEAYTEYYLRPELTTAVYGTFLNEPTERTAARAIYPFLTRLAQISRVPVPALYVYDYGKHGGRLHVDFAVAGLDGVPLWMIERAWKKGKCVAFRRPPESRVRYLCEKIVLHEFDYGTFPRGKGYFKALDRSGQNEHAVRLCDSGGNVLEGRALTRTLQEETRTRLNHTKETRRERRRAIKRKENVEKLQRR